MINEDESNGTNHDVFCLSFTPYSVCKRVNGPRNGRIWLPADK